MSLLIDQGERDKKAQKRIEYSYESSQVRGKKSLFRKKRFSNPEKNGNILDFFKTYLFQGRHS